MGCDMVVALDRATANGATLFGANSQGTGESCQALRRIPGRKFALEETVKTQFLQLPQARETFTVLGSQSQGTWGFGHGINDHQVVAGCSWWRTKMTPSRPGLTGPDLVRLVLERCRNARQAFDLAVNLVSRFGQGGFPEGIFPADAILLIADPGEAFLIETAGSSWASLDCHGVRAVSDVGLIRQDWHRIAPGTAAHAAERDWWGDDGSKLDFAGCLGLNVAVSESAMRRWGRATLLLEEQSGSIDAPFLRRLLADHYDGTDHEVDPLVPEGPVPLCRHTGWDTATTASMIAELAAVPEKVPMAWCAFGPPCAAIYLPIFLDGDLPEPLSRGAATPDLTSMWWRTQVLLQRMSTNPERWANLRQSLAYLQTRVDQETEDFLAEAAQFKKNGETDHLRRQASLFMQNHIELVEAEFLRLQAQTSSRPMVSSVDSQWF